MKIRVNKLHYPVEVLGPGRRAGIWVQGCSIRCFGCISRDTWSASDKARVFVRDVLDWVASLPNGGVDGITISGGEPFDQPEALQALLEGLNEWREVQTREIDFLAFSGRSYGELEADFPNQLALLDAVVSEPYVQGLSTDLPLRGSSNQRLVLHTPLGRDRYSEEVLVGIQSQRNQVQLAVDDESIWMIGIPEQGAMSRVKAQAAEAGLLLKGSSWLL